ncbi:hypothetical protein [Amycolatopsis sp. DG1A-15b]|uniref:hypothetical protein n=1 Tax=Amycolatopsis sp. DG1A-15b TaxID=3052846 RepID=UPI00255C2327|nr:hypothetical protein [Amycolatopsis sp. DG1A-15b]WIX86356.1 hypothetical protein QRY02_34930 [Amycolatopsis sp. DG1A-15b]
MTCGFAAVLACCASCTTPTDRARAASTEAVRARAQHGLQLLRDENGSRASLEAAVEKISEENPDSTVDLGRTVPASGGFVADFAFTAYTEAGGGGDYVQVAVRLCVSYSGEVSLSNSAAVVDRICPPGLPGSVRGVPVVGDVKLSD